MDVPCVEVAREDGETTRERLIGRGLLDYDHEITVAGGRIYLPVTDSDEVPEGYAVVEHDAPARETERTPADFLGFEPSYERLGEVVLLHEDDTERAREIATAVMASALPVKTVANRASKVAGEFRTREWEVLTGDGTATTHREYGCAFALDISEVYFSPRLATERHRVTQQVAPGEQVFDMFAGVGPFAIPAAERGAEVVAVDLNPAAVEFLRENVRRNGVTEGVTTIEGDVREIAAEYAGWAERVVMNLPHTAEAFLETAVGLAGEECVIHYYDIQDDEDPYGPGERAIRAAAGGYDIEIETRRAVRSYAPHELNVCLDARLRAN